MASLNRRSLALSAATLLAVTGCGPGDPDNGPGGDVRLAVATPPGSQPVDHVVWGLPHGEPRSVDPARVGAEPESVVVANMCESLLRLQPDFSVEPGLATSARWKDDNTFVIDLRRNATFWDGTTVTPDDVIFSIERQQDPRTQATNGFAFDGVKDALQTGPRQVTLEMTGPDAQFRNLLSGTAGMVVSRDFAERAGESHGQAGGGIMCTGPYEFDQWVPGGSLTMVANDSYRDGAPLVGEIEFRFISDSSTLTSALLGGEIDGAYQPPVENTEVLQNSDAGSLHVGPSTMSASFGPTTDEGPAADPRIRRALDLAVDKRLYRTNVLRGMGEPLKTFTPPLAWGGDPAADIYRDGYDALPDTSEPDVDAARALVTKAGDRGAPLVFAISAADQESLHGAQVVQDAGNKIGLDISIKRIQPTEFSAFFYDETAREGTDFVVTTGYVEVPGALYYAPQFATKNGLFNWSGYQNAEVARLLRDAATTTDPEESARRFVKAQSSYNEAKLQVTLGETYSRLFLRKGLTGATVSSAWLSSPWAARLGGTGT